MGILTVGVVVFVSSAVGLSLKGPAKVDVKKEVLLEEIRQAELLKDLEEMIQNLDDEQLDLLEAIMGKDIDEVSEFDMILAELVEMGMDESEVHDLKQLAALMYEFLVQVPEIATKLNLEKEYDLLDNIQLYLLGLPNKIGPLGYIALHNALEDGDEGIVDVVVEPVISTTAAPTTAASTNDEAKETPTYRRKRSVVEQVLN